MFFEKLIGLSSSTLSTCSAMFFQNMFHFCIF